MDSKENETDEICRKRQNEDPIVTLDDYLDAINEQEHEAEMLLAGFDDECTYEKGAMARQMLYACRTCAKERQQDIGVCAACSLKCHDDHDLVELYTKRNFQCDCGTSRCGNTCEARKNDNVVAPYNDNNSYAKNFDGLYCVCRKPYPDPENEYDQAMIQCVNCEDWFHDKCLQQQSEDTVGFTKQDLNDENKAPENEESSDGKKALRSQESTTESTDADQLKCDDLICIDCAEKNPIFREIYAFFLKPDETKFCVKAKASPKSENVTKQPLLFKQPIRELLCTCKNCKDYYLEHKLDYLLDENDQYKPLAVESPMSSVDKSTALVDEIIGGLLKKIPPNAAREIITGFNDMKSELVAFIGSKPKDYVVTSQDIYQFFADLQAKRRRVQKENEDLSQIRTL